MRTSLRCLHTSCWVVQLRLHWGLAGVVGERATHVFRQLIAAESQVMAHVPANDDCGSSCGGGNGATVCELCGELNSICRNRGRAPQENEEQDA